MPDKADLGQVAYDAWLDVMKLPYRSDWQDLSSEEQEAWKKAAKAVVTSEGEHA